MEFSITKKIAKHGNQAVLVIPKVLQETHLPAGTLVEVKMKVIK